MDHQKRHLFEKFQVQFGVGLLGLAVYVGLWPMVAPPDSMAPLSLLSVSGLGAALIVAACFCLLGFLAGALTIHLRPSAGPMTALLAMGALSLRSEKINVLLWRNGPGGGGTFLPLVGELIFLLGVVLLAFQAAAAGRALLARTRPGWLWKSPLDCLSADVESDSQSLSGWLPRVYALLTGSPLWQSPPRARTVEDPDGRSKAGLWAQLGLALLTTLIASQLFQFILARSDQRGQILFAIGAGFFLAVLIGNLMFPTRMFAAFALLPILVGMGHYLHATTAVVHTFGGWAQLPISARALPIDWATLGSGGALAGFWVSSRIREAKWFEKQQEVQSKA
ncbi:MAG: hypothetical protein ACLFUJ_16725 [Phycisphaerae bacterium]